MVFKQILVNAFALCLGFSIGMLVASPLEDAFRLHHSITTSLLIATLVGIIFSLTAHFSSKAKLSSLAGSESPEATDLQRQWAWLKPAGIVARSPYPLNKEQIIIGRDINCDIMLKDESISRRHAEVVRGAEGWSIHDLGSSNGTFVNGQRKEEVQLCEGDLITLGDINMTFEGPRRPIPTNVPETVSPISTGGDPLDPETQVHRIDGGDTEVWRPRPDLDDIE